MMKGEVVGMAQGFASRAVVALIAVLAVATAASGCGGSSASSAPDEKKVAFLLPEEPVVRYLGQPGFGEKVTDLCPKCKVLYANARGSATRQQAQAKAVLSEGADVLVLDPVDPSAAFQIAREARSAGVPVVAYVDSIPGAKVDYYVGVNGEGLGNLQGDALLTVLKQKGRPQGPIVAITIGAGGPQNASAQAVLHSGGVKTSKKYAINPSASTAQSFSLAKRDMGKAIDALGENGFFAVFTPDDETAAGAIAAMKAAGINPSHKPTTGAGASLAAVKRILVGEQYISAYEANWQVRSSAARLAVRLAQGEKVPASWITEKVTGGVPAILLQPTTVSAPNLMSTVIPYGFVKPRQLCVGRYARYCAEANRPIHPLR
jgi:D-xylose transport system substrate-binding protein